MIENISIVSVHEVRKIKMKEIMQKREMKNLNEKRNSHRDIGQGRK